MQFQKFFDPVLWLQACQCLCTRRKFAHKQFPFPLIQSITQSTQFHPSLNTKIYTLYIHRFASVRIQATNSFNLNIRVGLSRKFGLSMQLWECNVKANSILPKYQCLLVQLVIKTVPVIFVVNTVLIQYCVYYENYWNSLFITS